MITQPRITRLELALAGLTLFMFAEAFLPRLLAPGPADVTGVVPESTLLRYLWLPFYGLIAVGLFFAMGQAWRAVLRAPWLILLALLAIASALWSIDPELSFRRGVALLATTMMGVYLAARFDWLTALRLLGAVWFVLMAASFIAGIVAPGFARMSEVHVGAWMGGWSEKNALGGHAARAALLLAFLAWRDPLHRRWWIGGAIIALALVIFSRSATALLGAGLGLGVLFAAWWMLKGKLWSLALVWSGVSIGGLAILAYLTMPDVVLGLLGKDETLTGRTDIWASLGDAIEKKPVLGYGYLAFWGLDSEPRYWLERAVDWNAPSGHNGWLDLAISLGIVGVVIYAVDLAVSLWRAGRLSLASPAGVFALGFLAQFMLFAMSESIIIAQNSILWTTYAFVGARLALGVQPSQSMTPLNTAPRVGAASTAPASTVRTANSSIRSAGAP
jgi:exopolysaccharide production protein ExoQ